MGFVEVDFAFAEEAEEAADLDFALGGGVGGGGDLHGDAGAFAEGLDALRGEGEAGDAVGEEGVERRASAGVAGEDEVDARRLSWADARVQGFLEFDGLGYPGLGGVERGHVLGELRGATGDAQLEASAAGDAALAAGEQVDVGDHVHFALRRFGVYEEQRVVVDEGGDSPFDETSRDRPLELARGRAFEFEEDFGGQGALPWVAPVDVPLGVGRDLDADAEGVAGGDGCVVADQAQRDACFALVDGDESFALGLTLALALALGLGATGDEAREESERDARRNVSSQCRER